MARRGRIAGGALALGAALLAAAAPAEELSVLTYNVHGLPAWVARDDPEARMPAIAARADAYDVVLLQEDFAFHERLREATGHPLVRRGNPSRAPWCPVCNGAGLTLLSRLSPDALLTLDVQPYDICAGWLGGANDCFATKGFLRARLRLASGAVLDVVNTHLDAGRDDADREARRRQLAALAGSLAREVGDGALVVGGDFNLDADDAADAALLRAFAAELGLADSGARASAGSGFPALDYLLSRSGRDATLRVLEAGEDEGFRADGAALSDHPALFVRFEVAPAAAPAAAPDDARP